MTISIDKVLITGANGFIGSFLTRRLVKEGYSVGIIKRRSSNLWRIQDIIKKTVPYEIDLRETQELFKIMSDFKPDIVYHLATYYAVDHQPEEASEMTDSNVTGSVNILEAARASKVKFVVNTSSCFVYQENKEPLREDDNLDPLNLYALTKILAEKACTFYADKFGLKIATFRLFSPYGPADHQRRLIPFVLNKIALKEPLEMSSGQQRWDFIFVEDIVEAYAKILTSLDSIKGHEIFNLGTGKAVSIREIVNKIMDITGVESDVQWGVLPNRKNEAWHLCADIKKAKAFFEWQPCVQMFDKGLELTVKWYNSFFKGNN
ncbi:NAD-dependent epimerase/dehydratase family protein [Acidobacteriota bacterium]